MEVFRDRETNQTARKRLSTYEVYAKEQSFTEVEANSCGYLPSRESFTTYLAYLFSHKYFLKFLKQFYGTSCRTPIIFKQNILNTT